MNNRYSIFLDDTEVYTLLNSKLPTLYLYGGIQIEEKELFKLVGIIDKVKSKYGTLECPLKYNFKDLKEDYKRLNLEHLYQPLLQTSKTWRKEILEAASTLEYQIVISCVHKYHFADKEIKENKSNYTQYAFTYSLQRFGLEQRGRIGSTSVVYSDWPTGSDRKIFQKEYHSAYHHGYTSDWSHTYQCGSLSSVGFGDTLNFSIAEESRALQFTDLILGATKDLISKGLVGKESFGNELSPYFIKKFRGYPKVQGRGIVVSSNSIYKQQIENIFQELIYSK